MFNSRSLEITPIILLSSVTLEMLKHHELRHKGRKGLDKLSWKMLYCRLMKTESDMVEGSCVCVGVCMSVGGKKERGVVLLYLTKLNYYVLCITVHFLLEYLVLH